MRSLLVFFLNMLWLSSCMQVSAPEIRSVVCCELVSNSPELTELTFDMQIHNGNHFPITVTGHDLRLIFNGQELGRSRSAERTILGPGTVQAVKVSVQLSAKELLASTIMGGLTSLLGNKRELELEVIGTVSGRAKGISRCVRVHETYPIRLQP